MSLNKVIEHINTKNSFKKINYDNEMLTEVARWKTMNIKPKVLIHSCCAPCSTYVLEEMSKICDVTIYFSNSNIHPKEEYLRRAHVQKQFIADFNKVNKTNVLYLEDEYEPKNFIKEVITRELKDEKEGGKRCDFCFEMRLDRVADKASELNYDYFGSALTLSPHKNSNNINKIGFEVQMLYNVKYLPSDFKKRGGYQRSIQISRDYNVYRQCYCGCVFAANEQGIDLKKVACEAREYLQNK